MKTRTAFKLWRRLMHVSYYGGRLGMRKASAMQAWQVVYGRRPDWWRFHVRWMEAKARTT